MIIADLHLHTTASHGTGSLEEMFAAGKATGLQILGFSEHSPMPLGYEYPKEFRADLRAAFPVHVQSVLALKARANMPRILLGMELDWLGLAQLEFMQQTVAAYAYDYVLGGVHFLADFDFLQDEWKLTDQQCYMRYELYWQSVAQLAQSNLVQCVAHIDIIKIYTIDTYRQWLKFSSSLDLVAMAMQALAKAKVAMEVSSAGLRKPCQEIYPGPEIMSLASKYQIPLTFGSDAHCAKTPGHGFAELANYAASYGYTESLYFEQKQARSLKF